MFGGGLTGGDSLENVELLHYFRPNGFFLGWACDFPFLRMADLSLFVKKAHTWMSLDLKSMMFFNSIEDHLKLI